MALPPSGTFEYVVTVPAQQGPESFPWPLQLGEEITPRGDSLFDDRLVGYTPSLEILDGGVIADSFGLRDAIRRSRFTLRALTRAHASSREVSFYVDREVTMQFNPGDELRLRHSCMGGTGLTLLRNGTLIFAVGAVFGNLPPSDIQLKHPDDSLERIRRFESVPFENRRQQPLFLPIEIRVGQEMRSIYAGTVELGGYELWVEGGNYAFPSGDCYVAVSRKGLCDAAPAVASTMMLRRPGLTSVEWPK